MTRTKPFFEPGFLIDSNDRTGALSFLIEPEGNTRTPRQVLNDNQSKTPIIPKRKINRGQLEKEIRDRFIEENNIEEIPDTV